MAEQVIQRLIHTSVQGMLDGSANYWDEIAGFTDDEDSLPFKAVDDIRTLVSEAVVSLDPGEQFLVALQQNLSDEWVHRQLEKREGGFEEAGFEWEPEFLVEDVVHYVIEQAIMVETLRPFPISLADAQALCERVILGQEALDAFDLGGRLQDVGNTYPELECFEQAAKVLWPN